MTFAKMNAITFWKPTEMRYTKQSLKINTTE